MTETENRPTPKHVTVDGIVAGRNLEPYVILRIGSEGVQLSIADARQIAADMLQQASRYEADAMLFRFFQKHNFPEQAALALMMDFRTFRKELDTQPVERTFTEPQPPPQTKEEEPIQ
jgi:hypothetical protein